MAKVTDNQGMHRFEMMTSSQTAFIDYWRSGEHIILIHTELPEALEGQGIGSALVRGALDQVKTTGLRVVPNCSFVAGYVERNPEYQGLVAGS